MNRRVEAQDTDVFAGSFDWFKLVLLLMLGGGTASSGLSLYQSNVGSVDYITRAEADTMLKLYEVELQYIAGEVKDIERDLDQLEERSKRPELSRQISAAFERLRSLEDRINRAGVGE